MARLALARQVRNNRGSAGHWELYAEHRRILTAHVAALAGDVPARLCVLGAGNGNDLDVEELATRYAGLDLVDVDGAALTRSAARVSPDVRARLALHGGIDLGAFAEDLARWRRRPPSPRELESLPERAATAVSAAVPGPFDVVVSACMLSQVLRTCHQALGDGPTLGRVAHAAVCAHLVTMTTLTAPGGRCLLATDAVSSESYPLEELFSELDPLELLQALRRDANLFSGTSPGVILPLLRAGDLGRQVEHRRALPPWLWRVSPACTLLVYAVRFDRRR